MRRCNYFALAATLERSERCQETIWWRWYCNEYRCFSTSRETTHFVVLLMNSCIFQVTKECELMWTEHQIVLLDWFLVMWTRRSVLSWLLILQGNRFWKWNVVINIFNMLKDHHLSIEWQCCFIWYISIYKAYFSILYCGNVIYWCTSLGSWFIIVCMFCFMEFMHIKTYQGPFSVSCSQ